MIEASVGRGRVCTGIRLCDPALGRFLEVDPVEGGSCSDYDYVCGDPVNGLDLSGTCGKWMNALQLKACQQDEAKRNAAAAKKKAAQEAAARARRMTEKDQRMDVVRAVPHNVTNPIGDMLGRALSPVGNVAKKVIGDPVGAAVGCGVYSGVGAVVGGAAGMTPFVPVGPAAGARAGAAAGCAIGGLSGGHGPPYPQ
ncbi:MAG: repeat-containing protein [Frankiales bacterium]|nr:repeat-containing protein [Frankiales bacterium]